MTTTVKNDQQQATDVNEIPIWNDGPHIEHELTVNQMVEIMRNGKVDHEYAVCTVTGLEEFDWW